MNSLVILAMLALTIATQLDQALSLNDIADRCKLYLPDGYRFIDENQRNPHRRYRYFFIGRDMNKDEPICALVEERLIPRDSPRNGFATEDECMYQCRDAHIGPPPFEVVGEVVVAAK